MAPDEAPPLTVTVAIFASCAPTLSVTVNCTFKVPAAPVVTVAVGPLVAPLKAALEVPLAIVH